MKKITLTLFLAVCVCQNLSAQLFHAGIDFTSRFDNREYEGSPYSDDFTLFGMKIRPEGGITVKDHHSLVLSGDFTLDFGKKPRPRRTPELILYYKYTSEKFQAYTGIFPRDKVYGDYPDVFFSDSVRFYDANLEGALLQFRGRKGYVELAFDWNSMISHTEHEKFMLFSAGRGDWRQFSAGYYLMMYHHAGTLDISGVTDNLLGNVYLRYGDSWDVGRRRIGFSVKAGWLHAFQRIRAVDDLFRQHGGVLGEVAFRWHTLGLNNTIYAGEGLMPYYDLYGPGLYMGDPFYRTDEGIYNRLELYWEPVETDMLSFRLSSIHHYEGTKLVWQQLATLTFRIGTKKLFNRRLAD